MTPAADAGWYDVQLVEVTAEGHVQEEGGLLVSGHWNTRTNEHTAEIARLELNGRAYGICPQIVRMWWRRMDLSGSVSNVKVSWSPEHDIVSYESELAQHLLGKREGDEVELGAQLNRIGSIGPVQA